MVSAWRRRFIVHVTSRCKQVDDSSMSKSMSSGLSRGRWWYFTRNKPGSEVIGTRIVDNVNVQYRLQRRRDIDPTFLPVCMAPWFDHFLRRPRSWTYSWYFNNSPFVWRKKLRQMILSLDQIANKTSDSIVNYNPVSLLSVLHCINRFVATETTW